MGFPNSFKQVTCKKCGTVYVAVPRAWAEDEIASSTRWIDGMTPAYRKKHGPYTPPTLGQYEYCWCKNHYKNFRAFKKGDCPDGCTLSSIIRKAD
jgi:hypothetical protein